MAENNGLSIENVNVIEKTVQVKFKDGSSVNFEDCWLRDHCRCPVCYHADTFQRAIHILDIPDVGIDTVWHDRLKMIVTWDDQHQSTYTAEFLSQFNYAKWSKRRRFDPVLWRGSDVANKITRLNVTKFLDSEHGAKSVFQSLLDYGVALIEDVEPTFEATEAVCKALGGVQHTIFGGMWQFTTRADHADTAYTNLPLAVHNDNTYFTEAAGLQILHCLEHSNGTGGETLLTDGFYGATKLKRNCPEDYEFLTKHNVEAEYIEDGHHHKFSGPVIKVDEDTKDLVQIRFNVYDRSAMAFESKEKCRSYYRSLRNFARYLQDPANQWQFKLKPGTVMVMDNFRVLHGRTAFTGTRVLCGSYVARTDWLDKARVLKLVQ